MKDRIEHFLDTLMTNIKILRFLCIIAFIIIKIIYVFAYIYNVFFGYNMSCFIEQPLKIDSLSLKE
uniref:Uncharacterized protein n=1 Tax=viral metagenome TaxID=1070528 RepID=A0A6C0LH78_9ZZZZ